MSLSLINISAFELEQKLSYFVLSLLSIFLNTKTNVVTNLKPLNSDNNSIRLLLIANSVSLSCSSGLKILKISTLQVLAQPLKAYALFVIFTFFRFKKFTVFFVSLCQELLESTFSPFLIVLDDLCEVFECTIIFDFILAKFGF